MVQNNNALYFANAVTQDGAPSQGSGDPKNRHLKHAGKGKDNRWLIGLEQSVGTLPIRDDSQFDIDIEPYTLTDDQKEMLNKYEVAYEWMHELYDQIVRSFGYAPRFPL